MYLLQVKSSAYQWMHIWLTVNGYVVVFSANYQSFIVSFCFYFPTAYLPSPRYTSKSDCVVDLCGSH